MESVVSKLFLDPNNSESKCFNYNECYLPFSPCPAEQVHDRYRYSDASSGLVLISAIIVFFMKAGFILIELAFAQNVREKRHIVVLKQLDVFASAFGFFLIGFDIISSYSKQTTGDFKITDPILWFFKFTFASNAATIIGGCLVTNQYKLRLFAAFTSSFIISGIVHPLIARWIWSDTSVGYFSAYRFCSQSNATPTCAEEHSFMDRVYVLDFAGGGAVHLVGGVAGLVLCLFAKFQNYRANKRSAHLHNPAVNTRREGDSTETLIREEQETVSRRGFWEWMYPVDGGGETTNEAALGVMILWFCWFAFNCGSTESLESANINAPVEKVYPYQNIPSNIAITMILAASSGGITAILIASWAQVRSRSDSVNANEIANGILSALVAITAGCPFYEPWAACVVGVIAVIVYHIGCLLEYRLGIDDTARVVPVHGLCGLLSLLAVGLFVFGSDATCNLHITFEGLCYCHLRLPSLNYGERLAAQLIGACIMIVLTGGMMTVVYGFLYIVPVRTKLDSNNRLAHAYNMFLSFVFKIVFNRSTEAIQFEGNLLFTGPGEIPHANVELPSGIFRAAHMPQTQLQGGVINSSPGQVRRTLAGLQDYSAIDPDRIDLQPVPRETLGTVSHQENDTATSSAVNVMFTDSRRNQQLLDSNSYRAEHMTTNYGSL